MSLLIDKKSVSKPLLRTKQSESGTAPTRTYSDKQEKAVGKLTDSTQTISSGSTLFSKGDLLSDDGNWLIECKTKTTHAKSITIQKEWIEKNKSEALFMNRPYCALAFNFGPDEQNYFIIDQFLFQDLMEICNKK